MIIVGRTAAEYGPCKEAVPGTPLGTCALAKGGPLTLIDTGVF